MCYQQWLCGPGSAQQKVSYHMDHFGVLAIQLLCWQKYNVHNCTVLSTVIIKTEEEKTLKPFTNRSAMRHLQQRYSEPSNTFRGTSTVPFLCVRMWLHIEEKWFGNRKEKQHKKDKQQWFCKETNHKLEGTQRYNTKPQTDRKMTSQNMTRIDIFHSGHLYSTCVFCVWSWETQFCSGVCN